MEKVIGYWGISNTASLNVWDMNSDAMLVGVNNNAPEWFEIEHDLEPDQEDDVYAYIDFHGSRWRLDNCMRR